MSLLIELPHYRTRQRVQALKIAHTIPNPRGVELHFVNTRFTPIQVDAAWFDQQKVETGGYYTLLDGEPWFIAAALFDFVYEPAEGGAA